MMLKSPAEILLKSFANDELTNMELVHKKRIAKGVHEAHQRGQ